MKLFDRPIDPDFAAFRDTVLRRGTPRRVHNLELHQDVEIKDLIVARYDLARGLDPADPFYACRREIALQRFLGFDVVSGPLEPILAFSSAPTVEAVMAADTTGVEGQARGQRYWANEHSGPITSWADFENYPWPNPATDMDLTNLDWAERNLDPNMKVYVPCHSITEYVTFLFGYEPLCFKILLEPDLVAAVFEKIGQIQLKKAQILCDYDCVGMLFGGDDMGFKTGLLLPRDLLVDHCFPWYKKMAGHAHEKGKLFLLHSCGNIESIMEELIAAGIDGRHSYEDTITPVTEAKRFYGDRIAVIGGIDIHFLSTATPEQVRRRVRETLDICQPGGGYCLGTGNSVPNYIPLENYLAMLDEGRRYPAGY